MPDLFLCEKTMKYFNFRITYKNETPEEKIALRKAVNNVYNTYPMELRSKIVSLGYVNQIIDIDGLDAFRKFTFPEIKSVIEINQIPANEKNLFAKSKT